eukprot:3975700-Prymnesium_polylepis.1
MFCKPTCPAPLSSASPRALHPYFECLSQQTEAVLARVVGIPTLTRKSVDTECGGAVEGTEGGSSASDGVCVISSATVPT